MHSGFSVTAPVPANRRIFGLRRFSICYILPKSRLVAFATISLPPGTQVANKVRSSLSCTLCLTLSSVLSFPPPISAQDPTAPAREDVVRVTTELVQTDVMVFDKSGKFVKDLRREDFELRIDDKVRSIEFFEQVAAGMANEESQLAAARGGSSTSPTQTAGAAPLDRGRSIFFYLDDLHLDLSGTQLATKMVSSFVEKEMGQNDEVAITSPSGSIGFLQQLTHNKAVLRKALSRLRPRNTTVTDFERPPMTEYQALLVSRYDRDVTDFFVEILLRDNPGLSRDSAILMVQSRAQQTLMQAANVTRATLAGLESLIRSSSQLPGRKLVFFVSNGFFLDDRNSDSLQRLQRLTSAAARSGVVIYSMDARGLTTGVPDASADVAFDVSGRLARANQGELSASQDALHALAADTGGKAIFNTNALEPGLRQALKETSTYYLLAWKPDAEQKRNHRFRRIDVKIRGRTDLTVRLRRGYFDIEPTPTSAKKKSNSNTTEAESLESNLAKTMTTVFPERGLPVSLNLVHMNVPGEGDLLSISMRIPGAFLSFVSMDQGKHKAMVEIGGFVHNDKGQIGARFNQRLGVTTPIVTGNGAELSPTEIDVDYTFPVTLKPGLYQVRVGAVDVESRKRGGAQAWIEIPDLTSGQLAMSSLLIGERNQNVSANAANVTKDGSESANLSIDRVFARDSYLRFLVFIYNATRASADQKPDTAIQVQVLRDDQPVVTTVMRKLNSEGVADLARLPFAADVSLRELPPGRYVLLVTAIDRVTKLSTSQRARFDVL